MKTKTKNPLKLIKKYLGELMLIIGSGIFVYNILSLFYAPKIYAGHCLDMPNQVYWLTFSSIMIVCGILIIRGKKNK